MSQGAKNAYQGTFLESYDFNRNYQYLKKLIHALKIQNETSIRRELFGDAESAKSLSKREMKQLFRFLRRIEHHYEACCTSPIPEELEQAIRSKDRSEWLPWEQEAIDKADAWRRELDDRRHSARQAFQIALEKVRTGEKPW
jgi:hypothetical protein